MKNNNSIHDSSGEKLFGPNERKDLLWLWRSYLKKRFLLIMLVMFMATGQAAIYQQFLSLTERGLRVIFENGELSALFSVAGFVLLLFAIRIILGVLIPQISIRLVNNAIADLRRDIISRLITLDLAWFERVTSGYIVQRVVNQTQQLSSFFGVGLVNALRDIATIFFVSLYLLYQSPLLFSIAVIFMPCAVIILRLMSLRIRGYQRRAQAAATAYIEGLDEMSSAMRTVKISGQEEMERLRLFKGTKEMRDSTTKTAVAQQMLAPAVDVVSALIYALIIGGGGYLALSGNYDLDGASIIAFLIGLIIVFDPTRKVAKFFGQVQTNLVLLSQIREILNQTPQIKDHSGAINKFDVHGDIVFHDVRFSYDPETPLFQNLDLCFEGGKISAIVGATGSGKTTLLSLLSRLYEVEEGRIEIGGTKITDIEVAALRNAFSIVAQDIVIFNASIAENIRYVRPDASDAEIEAAAEAAELGQLMRDRGDAPLGARGTQLSGGQKQRIAIARAHLRNAPIILQDEATSALDQQTEARVSGALSNLAKNRTTIIVSHRLSAIAHADRIFVMEAGRVVEAGSHAELIAQGGLYAAMYDAQKSGYV